MQHGFEGTSMRLLTAKAGVNLAAVNYHFGSKDALIEAVFRRRLDPMNAARIAELDRLEKEAGGTAARAATQIIRAFVGASLRMIEDARGGGRNFIRLLGRTYTEPAEADPRRSSASCTRRRWSASRRRSSARCRRCRATSWSGACISCSARSPTRSPPPTRVQLIAGCKPEDRYDARLLAGAPDRVPAAPGCSRRCTAPTT